MLPADLCGNPDGARDTQCTQEAGRNYWRGRTVMSSQDARYGANYNGVRDDDHHTHPCSLTGEGKHSHTINLGNLSNTMTTNNLSTATGNLPPYRSVYYICKIL